MSYTVVISEQQRAILFAALSNCAPASLSGVPQTDETFPIYEDATMLLRCLGALPKEESETPGVIHGLCL